MRAGRRRDRRRSQAYTRTIQARAPPVFRSCIHGNVRECLFPAGHLCENGSRRRKPVTAHGAYMGRMFFSEAPGATIPRDTPMPALYVTEPGAVVRYRTGSLVVTLDEKSALPSGKGTVRQCLIEVEPHHVETIGLVGRVHMTAKATRLCLERGIPLVWMSRNGRLLGRLVPELSRTADLRLRQFRMFEDSDAALALGACSLRPRLQIRLR